MDFLGGGAGPTSLGSPGSGSLVRLPIETYETLQLDLTVPLLGIELVPARPGFAPFPYGANWIIDKTSGTQTTPTTWRAGNDPGHINVVPQATTSPSNADVTAANPTCLATGSAISAVTVKRIPNAAVFMDIVAGAQGTGGFTLLARYTLTVYWVAVG